MGRLRRFEEQRYVGTRDTMVFYDCDDEGEFSELSERVERDDLLAKNLLSAFGPDTPSANLHALTRAVRDFHPPKP